MLISRMLHDSKGAPLGAHEMKLVCAEQADFNGKVVDTPVAHALLYATMAAAGEQVQGPDAPITLNIWTEGTFPPDDEFPNGRPCQVQVWLLGSTSAIPVTQR